VNSDYKLADTLREEANRSEWDDIRHEEAEAKGRAALEANDAAAAELSRYLERRIEVTAFLGALALHASETWPGHYGTTRAAELYRLITGKDAATGKEVKP
jgi:hypothetical protein